MPEFAETIEIADTGLRPRATGEQRKGQRLHAVAPVELRSALRKVSATYGLSGGINGREFPYYGAEDEGVADEKDAGPKVGTVYVEVRPDLTAFDAAVEEAVKRAEQRLARAVST